LACSGYGSTVMVTAACGFAAAAEILNLIAIQP
jgi:tRNA A37 threonylcarbamoyladenosine dehydratase